MIAYIYRSNDNIITNKINNIISVDTNFDGCITIVGDTTEILGSIYNYIVLSNDLPNQNIGDVFNEDHLTDVSSMLDLTENQILLNDISSLQTQINDLTTNFNDFVDYILTNVPNLPQ
jgi:hypothetical protein